MGSTKLRFYAHQVWYTTPPNPTAAIPITVANTASFTRGENKSEILILDFLRPD
jgi:hypothetical protein